MIGLVAYPIEMLKAGLAMDFDSLANRPDGSQYLLWTGPPPALPYPRFKASTSRCFWFVAVPWQMQCLLSHFAGDRDRGEGARDPADLPVGVGNLLQKFVLNGVDAMP